MENKKICLALGLPGGIIALLFGVLSVFAGGGAPAIYALILAAFGVMGIVFSVFAVKRKWPRVALIVIGAIVIVLSFASVSWLLPGGLMLAAGIAGVVGKKRDKNIQQAISDAQVVNTSAADGAEVGGRRFIPHSCRSCRHSLCAVYNSVLFARSFLGGKDGAVGE